MPCYDPDASEYPKRAKTKINHLTQLLCRLGKERDRRGIRIQDQRCAKWFAEHRRIDALVKERDALNRELEKSDLHGWDNPKFARRVSIDTELDRFFDA